MSDSEQKVIWDFITEQTGRSRIQRVRWKEIFGGTLTEVITDYKEQGHNPEQTIGLITSRLRFNRINNPELERRVKISVFARYGEQNQHKKRTEMKGK